jgi:heat shock transcription factor 1
MDVRQMKGKQETMDSKLGTMKRENEALWRELSALRQKHAKQQQIVSKVPNKYFLLAKTFVFDT